MLIALGVSIILGILSGLGVGGGNLLMLWLTFVCGFDFQTAKHVNLLFFLPAAIIACLFQRKTISQNLCYILAASFAGCIAAGFFSYISQTWDIHYIKKVYGIILIYAAFLEFKTSLQKTN